MTDENTKSQTFTNPSQILAGSFLVTILIGIILLMLPYATNDNQGLKFTDALFTSTSAVCVTGLVVVDTGSFLSVFGQIVVMILIQIGGLGFMTIASTMAVLLGRKITFKDRLILKEALSQLSIHGIVKLVQYIIIMTFLLEGLGTIILAGQFSHYMAPEKALFYGLFHSISAFNNAGFDLFGNSLNDFQGNYIVHLTITFLFIIGGLGFIVLLNILQKKMNFKTFSLQTKVVLTTTIFLLLGGSILIFIIESTGVSMEGLTVSEKILASFFQSATARTAGFTTIKTDALSSTTQFFLIFLMFVGASPGSTGGGIKTTTFATAFLIIKNELKGQEDFSIFHKTLPADFVRRSFVVMTLSFAMVIFSTTVLTITESADFLSILFESVSAFGTVGLTLGLTPQLSFAGKIIVVITMFMGRIGPLTLFFALSKKDRKPGFKYPEEKIMIG